MGTVLRVICLLLPLVVVSACAGLGGGGKLNDPNGPRVQSIDLNNPARPIVGDGPADLGAAKNEWASLTVQISNVPNDLRNKAYSLRIHPARLGDGTTAVAVSNFAVYQVVSMPVDVNRAGYVRHTGLSATQRKLPRALLPLKMDDGLVNLAALPAKTDGEPLVLWIDVHIPPETPAGAYETSCDLHEGGSKRPVATLPVRLSVYDFVMPDERHLLMVSQINWERLTALYPKEFEAITPRLMNRGNERYREPVRVLDQLVLLAQQNRTEVVVPRVQPTVKWPAGRAPVVDWGDFDTVVQPWLRGDLFADHVPLGYWPLPAIDYLDRFDRESQSDYWRAAASHFDQMDWLPRSAIFMQRTRSGLVGAAESIQLSADAAELLTVHPQVRVAVPLQQDQIQLAGSSSPKMVDGKSAARLLAAAPALVSAPMHQPWPSDVAPPQKWLRTDLPGLVPYVGAGGDERDVRLWAWLAFLREAQLILWNDALSSASGPDEAGDPNELIWFYPGSWFGLDGPVPTVQLKWLRRAQQDYEYLWLARQRGQGLNALLMARLMAKPVEIQPAQTPEPAYAMMSGTVDPQAWAGAQRLLARTILLREPGQAVEATKQQELNLQTLQWMEPQERPLLIARTSQWLLDDEDSAIRHTVRLRLGIDVYNASDSTPDQNLLQWTTMSRGWQVHPQPLETPPLAVFQVQRYTLEGTFGLDQISGASRQPLTVSFTNGFTKRVTPMPVMVPVATSDRRQARLSLDGLLGDWDEADAFQDGPLVQMLDRPALQRQELHLAANPTSLYSSWADENFYLAFKVNGAADGAAISAAARNFVDYQFRRAWGEDVCEVLVQPVYADNKLGPVVQVACKPGGAYWLERRTDPRTSVDPWQPVEGAGLRYACTLDHGTWRGEIAIPWKVINDPAKGMPVLLRLNFSEHHGNSGQSASWAGPVDFGRDSDLMGLLYLRDVKAPGQ